MIQKASWIWSPHACESTALIFAKNIARRGRIKAATAYVSAMGVYELNINGRRVGDAVLAPGWTSYKKRVQYQRYDVGEYLTDAENEFCVHCGKGWAMGLVRGEDRRRVYVDHLSVVVALHLCYEDGREEWVLSGEGWQVYSSQVLDSEIYNGETQDLTAESRYIGEAALDTTLAGVELIPQEGEWIKEQERLPAKQMIVTPKGERVIDFGQNLAGYVEIRIKGRRGERVVLSHAEVLDGDGNFYTDNYRDAKNKMQYILSGGEDVLKPKFTFQGYRYIRLDEFPQKEIRLTDFTSVAVYSDMKRIGDFSCGNENINQLYRNIIWGQRSNFLDIPTDCPQRDERLGWTGDAEVFCRTAAINYDVTRFFKKWLGDMRAEQKENGTVPHVIPDCSGFSNKSPAVAWGDAAIICPWEIYLASGDRSVLEQNFDMMARHIECIHAFGDEEFAYMGGTHFGDWLAMDAGEGLYYGATQTDLLATAYFAYTTSLMVKVCKVLGKDTVYYETLNKNIRACFRRLFMENGLPKLYPKYDALATNRPVKAVTQTSLSVILRFGLCEESERERLASTLVRLIRDNGTRLTTGFIGTPHILHALSENGYADVAYDLLLQEKSPSWLYSVLHGATTIWEHWDSIKEDGSFWSADMNSFNHYAYGSVYDWIFGVAAGIQICEDGAGYEKMVIAPHPDRRLGHINASIDTKFGVVRSAWVYGDGEEITYEITVPQGCLATLRLPSGKQSELEGGHHIIKE